MVFTWHVTSKRAQGILGNAVRKAIIFSTVQFVWPPFLFLLLLPAVFALFWAGCFSRLSSRDWFRYSIVIWLFAVVTSSFGCFWILCGLFRHSIYLQHFWGFEAIQFQLFFKIGRNLFICAILQMRLVK